MLCCGIGLVGIDACCGFPKGEGELCGKVGGSDVAGNGMDDCTDCDGIGGGDGGFCFGGIEKSIPFSDGKMVDENCG